MRSTLRSKLTFTIFTAAILFCSNNLKAQDDSNCGFVIDGVLADSMPNWAFSDLYVVFPITPELKKYDLIKGYVRAESYSGGGIDAFTLKPEDLADFSDAEYGVFYVWKKENKEKDVNWKKESAVDDYCNTCKQKWDSRPVPADRDKDPKPHLQFVIRGYKIIGYTNGETKEPIYDSGMDGNGREVMAFSLTSENGTLLYKSKEVPFHICYCVMDQKTHFDLQKTNSENKCKECDFDYSKPPIITGKKFGFTISKVDYVGKYGKVLKGTSSIGNTNTVVKTNNTTTKTTTTKTTTSSSAQLKSSLLKPLDKTKPGYFSEKNDEGKIIKEGFKKVDKLNGEVREYNDEGKLTYVRTYVNDEENGLFAQYDEESGDLVMSGNKKGGEKDGEWKMYENGKITKTVKYVNGEEQE